MDMNLLQHFQRLFVYDQWANRETLASLQSAAVPPSRSNRWMGHILAAEWLWLARLQEQPTPMAVWPELNQEACEIQVRRVAESWRSFLDGLEANSLTREIAYTNSKGERFNSTVQDVLLHVVMHSAYH